MIQHKQLPALLFLSFLTACGNGLEEGSTKTQATTPPPPPVTIQPAKQQAQPAPVTASTNTSNLNPPHGQPGHRCDIQVGAPLNSAPSAPATATVPQQQTITVPPPTIAPVTTTTAAGKNPPHGQPGHRCDIAVGAPLPK